MLNIVVAYDSNRGIGINNALPWHIPEDLRHFKDLTSGNAILMGRKTFESIGRPLPRRDNIILTQNRGYLADGCTMMHNLAQVQAYMVANKDKELFVIGGSEVYRLFLPFVDRIYATEIHGSFMCDTFFPLLDEEEWSREIDRSNQINLDGVSYRYDFTVYDKISSES